MLLAPQAQLDRFEAEHLIYRKVAAVGASIAPVEAVGWDGDVLDAQAFTYFALRPLVGLPLPGTTGIASPATGGVVHRV